MHLFVRPRVIAITSTHTLIGGRPEKWNHNQSRMRNVKSEQCFDLHAGNAAQCNMAADTGMDTCPSPEIPDSRKRPLDGDVENGVTKKSHYAGGGDGTYHFKLLVPSTAAGAIIGKGGETIAQLQKDTGARVKMSKANDFYPATTERICLITGTVDAIMLVLIFIMEKIREKPDLNAKQAIDFDSKTAAERDKQVNFQVVKILVPNSTAGMIIGKGGNYIKQIKEESGSYVQISQKAKDQTLQERCITVIGDMESNKTACRMILVKIVEDPQSGSCLNVSYADVSGPVANYNPTGSPYANSGQHTPMHSGTFSSTASLNTTVGGMLLNGLNLSLNLGSPTAGTSLTTQLLEHIQVVLRGSGFSEQATGEITAAMSTLARYGILGMGLGLAGAGTAAGGSGPAGYLGADAPASAANGGGAFGPIGTVSAIGSPSPTPRSTDRFGCPSDGYDPFRRQASSPGVASPASLNSNSFGLGTGGAVSPLLKGAGVDLKADHKKVDVEISESIVGAILGPGGRALVEIQHLSGASIQISKKGTFAPGTRNRIVTISGTPNAITNARYLIEQRVSEEEAKRARHGSLGPILQ
ncbi:RNA-binding protein Pasilla isoform X1 [Schistocerca piceifrons]|uniref:RNA-binding protein Pasilla isoform X1 n=1 Tax=Schistocerca piceifrons TaxID=274613 RepID=UPI001F5F91A7|nr:RNA-binding protein Pasilla isoform X1 [Schistocerca piceifrons]